MTGRVFKILVAVPFALIPLALIIGKSVSFERIVLTPGELAVLEYAGPSHENIEVIERGTLAASAKIAKFNPFLAIDEKQASFPGGPGQEPDGQAGDGRLHVTLTVLNEKGNMAVINDRLVREGDSIRGMKVKRIENNRVLLVDRKSAPLYLEGSK